MRWERSGLIFGNGSRWFIQWVRCPNAVLRFWLATIVLKYALPWRLSGEIWKVLQRAFIDLGFETLVLHKYGNTLGDRLRFARAAHGGAARLVECTHIKAWLRRIERNG
jgi:hypothetical protein